MLTPASVDIGARVEIARLWTGISRPEAAARWGITDKTYASYVGGYRNIPQDKLSRGAAVLGVTTDYLLRGPVNIISSSDLSYRRRVSMRSNGARRIQGIASIVCDYLTLIETFVKLPKVTVPYATTSANAGQMCTEIESITRSIRQQWAIGDAPLRHALDFVEALGVLVFWVDSDVTFDGVSFWCEDRPYILLNRSHRDGYRVRFTVLHELGHLILHRKGKDIDQQEEERKLRDREADAFASSMMMPANSFAKHFPHYGELDNILEERRYWMASCAAMVRRARDIHIINEDRYRRFCVQISARGWRRGEPGAHDQEQSRIHKFFLDEAGEHGYVAADLAQYLAHPLRWFLEAFPLASGYQFQTNMAAFT